MKAKFVFQRLYGKEKCNSFWSLGMECPLWTEFDYYELTENVRQKNDPVFQEVLTRIRLGNITAEDIEILQGRQQELIRVTGALGTTASISDVANLIEQKMKEEVSIMYLSPKNSGVDAINDEMIKRTNKKVYAIDAKDEQHAVNFTMAVGRRKRKRKTAIVAQERRKKISETAGLETNLRIFVGARVILLRNKDVCIDN